MRRQWLILDWCFIPLINNLIHSRLRMWTLIAVSKRMPPANGDNRVAREPFRYLNCYHDFLNSWFYYRRKFGVEDYWTQFCRNGRLASLHVKGNLLTWFSVFVAEKAYHKRIFVSYIIVKWLISWLYISEYWIADFRNWNWWSIEIGIDKWNVE